MSVTIQTVRASAAGPVEGFAGARREPGRAHFTTRWGRTGGLIRVVGDIDAANADHLVDQVRQATWCEWLVLDLTTVEFMGTAGIAALQTSSAYCADAGVRWTMVAGRPVSRLLAVCDHVFPTSESLTAALGWVRKLPDSR